MKKFYRNIQCNTKGFALNEMLGVVAALAIAAFVVIPGLKGFAQSIINDLDSWWLSLSDDIFTW